MFFSHEHQKLKCVHEGEFREGKNHGHGQSCCIHEDKYTDDDALLKALSERNNPDYSYSIGVYSDNKLTGKLHRVYVNKGIE